MPNENILALLLVYYVDPKSAILALKRAKSGSPVCATRVRFVTDKRFGAVTKETMETITIRPSPSSTVDSHG